MNVNGIYLFLCEQEQDDRPYTKTHIPFCEEFDCGTQAERLIKQAAELGIVEGRKQCSLCDRLQELDAKFLEGVREGRRALAEELLAVKDWATEQTFKQDCIGGIAFKIRELCEKCVEERTSPIMAQETAKAEPITKREAKIAEITIDKYVKNLPRSDERISGEALSTAKGRRQLAEELLDFERMILRDNQDLDFTNTIRHVFFYWKQRLSEIGGTDLQKRIEKEMVETKEQRYARLDSKETAKAVKADVKADQTSESRDGRDNAPAADISLCKKCGHMSETLALSSFCGKCGEEKE